MRQQFFGGLFLLVLGLFGFFFAAHRLQVADRDGRFWHGKHHRYYPKGDPGFDGLVTTHRMLMVFMPFVGIVGAVVMVRAGKAEL